MKNEVVVGSGCPSPSVTSCILSAPGQLDDSEMSFALLLKDRDHKLGFDGHVLVHTGISPRAKNPSTTGKALTILGRMLSLSFLW